MKNKEDSTYFFVRTTDFELNIINIRLPSLGNFQHFCGT